MTEKDFIKLGDKYLVKGTNSLIVNEEEKNKLLGKNNGDKVIKETKKSVSGHSKRK